MHILALEIASPRNQHCANCIGTLSFPIGYVRINILADSPVVLVQLSRLRRSHAVCARYTPPPPPTSYQQQRRHPDMLSCAMMSALPSVYSTYLHFRGNLCPPSFPSPFFSLASPLEVGPIPFHLPFVSRRLPLPPVRSSPIAGRGLGSA